MLSMKSMQLYADGKLTSLYPVGIDGPGASLTLELSEELRIHAGGRIEVRSCHIFCENVITKSIKLPQFNTINFTKMIERTDFDN